MRAQTKIAVGVGVVLIILGVVYFRSPGEKPPQSVADNSNPNNNPADAQPIPTEVVDSTPPASVSDLPVVKANTPTDVVASPASRQIDVPTLHAGSGTPRSSASDTDAPGAPAGVSTLPPERAGLSSLPPARLSDAGAADAAKSAAATGVDLGSDPVGHADSSSDMPPNVDRHSPPPATVTVGPVTTAGTPLAGSEAGSGASRVGLTADSTPGARIAPPMPAAARTHIIQKGDNYTSLAIKYFHNAKYAKLIEKANPGREPTRLYVGAKINIPEAPEAAASTPSVGKNDKMATKTGKTDSTGKARSNGRSIREAVQPPDPNRAYVVQPGDTWQALARKFMGRADADAELYEWNKERVGSDPNLLRAGLAIELPPQAKMPAKPSTPAAPK